MKTIKSISFYLTVLMFGISLSSCEDVIQVKLDEGSKLLIVDAFINDLPKTQEIVLTNNDSYFSNKSAPPVTNANVELKDLTNNKTFVFNHIGVGKYQLPYNANDSVMRLNHQYELNITYEGQVFKSTTTLKRGAVIDSVGGNFDENGSLGGPGGAKGVYYAYLYAKDKVDANTDYYWIKTFRNDTAFNKAADMNTSIDGTNGSVSSGLDSLSFTPPVTFLGFKVYRKFDVCRVEIHSISKECYNFLNQAVAQINNGGLFATTPENVKTNITTPSSSKIKAAGWFSVSKVTTKTKLMN
jgi:hypothetical protein